MINIAEGSPRSRIQSRGHSLDYSCLFSEGLSKRIQIAVLVPVLFFLYNCQPPIEERVEYGPPPIYRIDYFGSRIEVYSDLEWPSLIHTKLFNGFRPGMNFQDAVKSVGLPDKKGRGLWGPYYEYQRAGGTVEVSFETIGSGLTGAAYSSWRLTAYPYDGDIAELIAPVLRERIPHDFQKPTELALMNPKGGYPVLSMKIAGGRVRSINWLAD